MPSGGGLPGVVNPSTRPTPSTRFWFDDDPDGFTTIAKYPSTAPVSLDVLGVWAAARDDKGPTVGNGTTAAECCPVWRVLRSD